MKLRQQINQKLAVLLERAKAIAITTKPTMPITITIRRPKVQLKITNSKRRIRKNRIRRHPRKIL